MPILFPDAIALQNADTYSKKLALFAKASVDIYKAHHNIEQNTLGKVELNYSAMREMHLQIIADENLENIKKISLLTGIKKIYSKLSDLKPENHGIIDSIDQKIHRLKFGNTPSFHSNKKCKRLFEDLPSSEEEVEQIKKAKV